jgi:hypothetical protein
MSASSPEELETLLEDAVLLGDEAALLALFEAGAVLIIGPRVTGPERALAELATLEYVAATRTVTERRDLAVIVGDHAVNVSCRAPDGVWRLVAAIVRPRAPHDSNSTASQNGHREARRHSSAGGT